MNGLEQVFGQPRSIIGQQLGLQAFNQQQDNQALDGAGALQKMFQAEQMNPLKLAEQGHINNQYEATLPGHRANSDMLARKNRFEDETYDESKAAKLSDWRKQISDDERKMADNLAQQLARSNDPALKKIGLQMIADSEPVVANKLTTGYASDRDERKIRLQGQVQHGLLDKQIGAGRFKGAARTAGGTDFWSSFYKMKNASERYQALNGEIEKLRAEDPDANAQEILKMQAMATSIHPQAVAELKGVPAPGKAALGELGIQVTPDINITPANVAAPAAKPDYNTWTMQQWMQRYPGKSQQEIMNALKAKGITPK